MAVTTTINISSDVVVAPIARTPGAGIASQIKVYDPKTTDDVAVVLDLGFPVKVAPSSGGGYDFGRLAVAALTRDDAESLILALRRTLDGNGILLDLCVTCRRAIWATGADLSDADLFCSGRGRHGESSTIVGPRETRLFPRHR